MKTILRYKGFSPNEQTKAEIAQMIQKLKHFDIGDATVLSYLEFDGQQFLCSVDVLLMGTSVYTTTTQSTIQSSIEAAEHDICNKLAHTKQSRYYENQAWYME